MAEKYGKLPTEVARVRPDEYTRTQRFRLDQSIFRATEQFKEQHEGKSPHDSGVGTEAEKKELVQNQIDRSEETHGSLAEQKEALS